MVTSGVWKPTAAEPAKKIGGSVEIASLKLISSGGAAVVSFYDSPDATGATPSNLKWVLDASTTDNDKDVFGDGLPFNKGIWAVCEQGADTNPIVLFTAPSYGK